MELSEPNKEDVQALLLLTTDLGDNVSLKPLTLAQCIHICSWLDDNKKRPGDLFHDKALLDEWIPTQKNKNKRTDHEIRALLDQGMALSVAMSRWGGAGLWVMTYLDHDYPEKLKQRLPRQFPPFFHGVGTRSLLQGGGLAVVGSRNAPSQDLEYARGLGKTTVHEGEIIISGGARGVDINAMKGALNSGGSVVGILTSELLKQSVSRKYRDSLESGKLVLVSVTDPESKLSRYAYVSASMQRNKYIYCLSDAAVVVRSGTKGGTWKGALENLKKAWVPLWVKKQEHTDTDAGNDAIVNLTETKKALWIPENWRPGGHLLFTLQKRKTAISLITISLHDDHPDDIKPLNSQEWKEFTKYLLGKKRSPAQLLLHQDLNKFLDDWDHKSVSIKRIQALLTPQRQDRLSKEEAVWNSKCILLQTRGDVGYPQVLKQKLLHDCPPLLFVCGNQKLLAPNIKRTIVLGKKQNVTEDDLSYANSFGTALGREGRTLIATCVSKIEKEFVQACLDNGGKCIIVLHGNLAKNSENSNYRDSLENGKILLLSVTDPNAGYDHSTLDQHYAIACALSSNALVVRSGKKDVIARCMYSCQEKWNVPVTLRETEVRIRNRIIPGKGFMYFSEGDDVNTHIQELDRC